jgi:hypothetical protein
MAACMSASGQAADYAVAYGIELNGIRDTGVLTECEIARPCEIRDARGSVVVWVMIDPVDSGLAQLSMHEYQRGCCVFAGGSGSRVVDVRKKLISVPLFAGRRLQRNEWNRNISVGTLWLAFSDVPEPKTRLRRPQTDSGRGPI